MPFFNIGFFTIADGATVRVGVVINGGENWGPQYVASSPIAGTQAELVFRDHSKLENYFSNQQWSYWTTVTNNGPYPTPFQLEGGTYA